MQNKNPSVGGSMDIFWNYTLIMCSKLTTCSMVVLAFDSATVILDRYTCSTNP